VDPSILSALTRPGTIAFPSNRSYVRDLAAAGGLVVRQFSGHLVFYGSNGRRFLATDPEGNPLHECEWTDTAGGATKLARARLRLDWGQWVGLRPEGLSNSTTLDLSRKPGWERLQTDDLRRMAAQALRVPLEEVRFFYGDEDLVIAARGRVSIRHKKDAFYVLDGGTFDHARFMACMGAMHWTRIDFLPVVELFQSLLPGTGSAAFELIRGLYDDQNPSEPLPLRYRGIPTYPSEAAYRLFSGFFTPHAPGGADPFPIFMDVPRSHEVTWLPSPDPPRRYFDPARHLCVTVKGETVQKATLSDDPTGLPFAKPGRNGFAPCERSLEVTGGALILKDGEKRTQIPANPSWGTLKDSISLSPPLSPGEGGWRTLFGGPPPQVTPAQAFSAVLLYPEDDAEIDEAASQPFVADYLQDLTEQEPELAASLAKARQVLIHNFDAALTTCISLDHPGDYTVLYRLPEFAQKQAQVLWNQCAQVGHLDWMRRIRLLQADASRQSAYEQTYAVVYQWVPFSQFNQGNEIQEAARAIAGALIPGGLAFVVGPSTMGETLRTQGLSLRRTEEVETLPAFRMHQTILPRARVKAGLTVFQLTKG
jgi:hypothetical protein